MRLEASKVGAALWRNNNGACTDERGNFIRYGLANDSKKMNKVFKSADLIGIRPVMITQAHIGCVIGQFIAREMKEPGWFYTDTPREQAQANFLNFIKAKGGDAQFATGPGTL